MNSDIADLRRHLSQKVSKELCFKKSRRRTKEASLVAQTRWITTLSPTRESPLIKNDIAIVLPTIETIPDPLSRLLSFPDPITNDENASCHSLRLRESFFVEAQLIKRKLIKNLISIDNNDADVEFMIDLANVAFSSLRSLHSSFGQLYDAVKEFISYHYKLLEIKREIEKNGCIHHMLLHKADLARQTSEVAKAQTRVKTALAQSCTSVAKITTQIQETRVVLNQLEKKLAKDSEKVSALRIESDKLEKSHEEAKSEHQDVANKIEELKATKEETNSRHDRAKVWIDNVRATLTSLYWNDLDN